jgi:hypothetical protein
MANGTLKVENIQTSSGSGTVTIGQSGETATVASDTSDTLNVSGNLAVTGDVSITGQLSGGQKEYASFYGSNDVTLGTGYTLVDLSGTFKNSNTSVFSLASDIVTVNKTGTYLITYDVVTDCTSGSARTESQAELFVNDANDANTFSGMYNRLAGQGLSTGGDNLRIKALKTGTDTVASIINRLTIMEL